jgi:hypothetical protein
VSVAVLALAWMAATGLAQEKAPENAAAKPAGPWLVAVLNFETTSTETSSYGSAIPDLLTAFLSADPNLQLVERAQIKKILEEMSLGKTGIVDEESKAKIGHLTGAKFLITGRAMIVSQQLFITAKIMGAETGQVKALVAKGPLSGKLDEIVQDLATKISALMVEKAADMLPKIMTEKDVVDALQKQLEGRKLPKFAVLIPEGHVSHWTVDPAAETEVCFLLKSVGATLINTKEEGLSDWAVDFIKENGKAIPTGLSEADIIIIGQGFSELAGATEKLISVKARVEMKAVDVKSGNILAIGRATATAVDLAENIAAKDALQKAAEEITLKLIPQAVDNYEKANKAEEKPASK